MVVALSVAVLLAVGSCLGWFARGSYGIIQNGGRDTNKQVVARRATSEDEIEGALRRVHVLNFEDAARTSHVRASSK
jgi:hypothetical protein